MNRTAILVMYKMSWDHLEFILFAAFRVSFSSHEVKSPFEFLLVSVNL